MRTPLSWRLMADEIRDVEWIWLVASRTSTAALQWMVARVADYAEVEE